MDYELTIEGLLDLLERAHKGEKPADLLGEFLLNLDAPDDEDEDEFGCCGGGPCNCE